MFDLSFSFLLVKRVWLLPSCVSTLFFYIMLILARVLPSTIVLIVSFLLKVEPRIIESLWSTDSSDCYFSSTEFSFFYFSFKLVTEMMLLRMVESIRVCTLYFWARSLTSRVVSALGENSSKFTCTGFLSSSFRGYDLFRVDSRDWIGFGSDYITPVKSSSLFIFVKYIIN